MLDLCLALSLALAPQDPQESSNGEAVIVGIDEDGRPIYGTRPESSESGAEAPGTVEVEIEPQAEAEPPTAPITGFRADGGAHPLDGVLAAVGTRSEFASITGLRARVTSTVLDRAGRDVQRVDRRWYGVPGVRSRDRFESPDGSVLIVDGPQVRALRADGSNAASDQALGQVLSNVLRLPWSLADEERFDVEPASPGRVAGTVEFRAVARPRTDLDPLDARTTIRRDVYVLICDANTLQPLGLRLDLNASGDGRPRRLYFAASRRVGAVEMLSRIDFLHADGRVASRLEVSDLAAEPLDESLFALPETGSEGSVLSSDRDASEIFGGSPLRTEAPGDDG